MKFRASSGANPTVSISVQYLHATTTAVQPSAAVSCVLPAAAVSYVEFVVSAVLDESGRYRYITDSSVVLDQSFISTAKAFADAVSISDSTPVLSVDKSVGDSISLTDAITVTLVFIRNFADSVGVSDTQAYAFVKSLVDSVSTTDQLYFAITKLLTDGVGMIDSFDLTDGAIYTFTKALSNVSFATDAVTLSSEKGINESVTLSSAGSLFSQGYCDLTYFAEDYVGEARTFT